jgi:hypothetical protein
VANLTALERETLINFNDEEDTAVVFSYNASWCRQMDKLADERPDEVRREFDNQMGGTAYIVPKGWVSVRPKRKVSDSQREQARERMKRMRGGINV